MARKSGRPSRTRLSDAELRTRGWQVLVRELGPAGAARFLMLEPETGATDDFASIRDRTLGGLSVDELIDRMRRRQD